MTDRIINAGGRRPVVIKDGEGFAACYARETARRKAVAESVADLVRYIIDPPMTAPNPGVDARWMEKRR